MILTADIAAIFSTGKGALITAWRLALISPYKAFQKHLIGIIYIYV